MATNTVKAVWHGPYAGDLGAGQPTLYPGDTYDISPELLESGHWTAVETAKPVSTPPAPARANPTEVTE